MSRRRGSWRLALAGMSLSIVACLCTGIVPTQSPTTVEQAAVEAAPTEQAVEVQPTEAAAQNQEVRQWASSASASTEYGADSWAAYQAAGAPDTQECGDIDTAWASSESNGVDWLRLEYDTPVIPTSIEVHQTYNPGAINRVEVVDEAGTTQVVFEAEPTLMDTCPYVLVVPVDQVTIPVSTVIVYIDQSTTNNWDEIDAVELIGVAGESPAVAEAPDTSGAEGGSGTGGEPIQADVTGVPVTGDDYCAGLTIEEVGAAYGVTPEEMKPAEGSSAYFCQYYFTEDTLRLDLTIYTEDSPDAAKQRYTESTLLASSNEGLEELSGPWDAGFWTGGSNPSVEFQKGSIYVVVYANYYDPDTIPESARQATIDLAMLYAERLP